MRSTISDPFLLGIEKKLDAIIVGVKGMVAWQAKALDLLTRLNELDVAEYDSELSWELKAFLKETKENATLRKNREPIPPSNTG